MARYRVTAVVEVELMLWAGDARAAGDLARAQIECQLRGVGTWRKINSIGLRRVAPDTRSVHERLEAGDG